jgi:hypothetical protein
MLPSITWQAGPDWKINAGGEVARTSATGNSLGDSPIRWQGGSFTALQYVATRGTAFRTSLYPSLRFDSFTGSVPAWSPQLAIVAALDEIKLSGADHIKSVVRISASRAGIPTFNELL